MPPGEDEVRQELERVVCSEALAGAARLRRFLRYVVERTLAGEGGQLKEYAIGVDVFDRDGGYDPRLDSIVRVEAGRLRAKLDVYYAGPGAADDVLIRMPRGGYAPEFERRAEAPAIAPPAAAPPVPARRRWIRAAPAALLAVLLLFGLAAWRGRLPWRRGPATPATIAVLPFAHHSTRAEDELMAARLTDGVTAELARLGTLGVVSHTSALQFAGLPRSIREIARTLGADVVLEATLLTEGDRLKIQARLVDGTRDRKFWVEDFAGETSDVPGLQRRIALSVTDAVRARRPR